MQVIIPPSRKASNKVEDMPSVLPEMREMINFIVKKKFIVPGSRNNECLALAQPQVSDKPLRYFVINPLFRLPNRKDDRKLVDEFGGIAVVNPKIISKDKSSKVKNLEGCFSFPFRPAIKVNRYNEITVSYDIITVGEGKDKKPIIAFGKIENKVLTGLAAMVFQHEFEHLNGKTIFDNK